MLKFVSRSTALALVLLVTGGCATMGMATPKSVDQGLAYSTVGNTALLQATADGVNQGSISKADGKAVLSLVENAQELINSGKAIEDTDATGAAANAKLATAVLTEAQKYVDAHKKAPTP